MDAAVTSDVEDRFVTVAGLKTRYFETGGGPPVILLHGASLGSSADVWRRNLEPLARHGLRVIAYDQPGFGLSDDPPEWGLGFRTAFILQFMDALGLAKASMIGHSQAGAMAVDLALSYPDRVSRVMVLGTGSLLPPLADQPSKKIPVEGEEGGDSEPTLAEARVGLENTLFNQALATDAEVALRHRMSTGKNHRAFLARNRTSAAKNKNSKDPTKKPLWQRLTEVCQSLLLIYGREDRGQAAKRAELAKQQFPSLDLHIVPNCKHLVQWDAADEFHRLAGLFLRG
ncbi:MAG: 4,5:9,10-diseco-3-hydroxy-5,9,17-trioxoandrosta(10),2-diene-4-oate hydrolase [Alphaproteobacteria bacterium]|jgi:pimeloyl-ACP methyl ester carboxylesterase|nr:4,5:9,10-diseco-3-hydroxy-5,9,17-trioxoandrosta(10),2-diene-4-oate hydrolase [Alphaproteobacteria bacterium]